MNIPLSLQYFGLFVLISLILVAIVGDSWFRMSSEKNLNFDSDGLHGGLWKECLVWKKEMLCAKQPDDNQALNASRVLICLGSGFLVVAYLLWMHSEKYLINFVVAILGCVLIGSGIAVWSLKYVPDYMEDDKWFNGACFVIMCVVLGIGVFIAVAQLYMYFRQKKEFEY